MNTIKAINFLLFSVIDRAKPMLFPAVYEQKQRQN